MTELRSYTFGTVTLTGSNFGPTYSTIPIVGEVVKVVWDRASPIDANGSIWVGISGIGNPEVHRINGFSADVTAYPFVYLVNNVNTTGSPQAFGKYFSAEPLYIAGSGLGSGLSAINSLTVWYTA